MRMCDIVCGSDTVYSRYLGLSFFGTPPSDPIGKQKKINITFIEVLVLVLANLTEAAYEENLLVAQNSTRHPNNQP